MAGLNQLAVTATQRKIGNRGGFSSSDWNGVIGEVAASLAAFENAWNTELQPLIDSLPSGSRNIALSSVSASIDPWNNGFDGANVYMDTVASTTRDDGLFYHTTLSRPRSIKEGVLEVRNQILQTLADVEAKILLIDENSGLTEAQKIRIGINIFNPDIDSADASNEGRSLNNLDHVNQLRADVFGTQVNTGDDPGDAPDNADYAWNATGVRSRVAGQSIVELIAAGVAANDLDGAYEAGNVIEIDAGAGGVPVRINVLGGAPTEGFFVSNALADTSDGIRVDRTGASATGYAIVTNTGPNAFNFVTAAGGATVETANVINLIHTGVSTGTVTGLLAQAGTTFTSTSAPLQGFWADLIPVGGTDAWGMISHFSSAALTSEPAEVNLFEARLTHANAAQAPAIVRGFHFEPDFDAAGDSFTTLEGFHFNPGAEIDGSTLTNMYGFRGSLGSGSAGTITNIYGIDLTLDATNLGSTISRGIHLNLTGMDQGILLDQNGTTGAGWVGYELDADIAIVANGYYGQRFNLNLTQQAGGPTSGWGSRITAADGNHLDDMTALYGYYFDYDQSDATHRPDNAYGFFASYTNDGAAVGTGNMWGGYVSLGNQKAIDNAYGFGVVAGTTDPEVTTNLFPFHVDMDISAAATVPANAFAINVDVTNFEKGLYINMDGAMPGATTWTGIEVEFPVTAISSDDTEVLRGFYLNAGLANVSNDNDRIIGVEIGIPSGCTKGFIFTLDNEHDIGQSKGTGGGRPRNIYIKSNSYLGEGILSDGKVVHGTAENTTAGAASVNIKTVTLLADHVYHFKAVVVGNKTNVATDQFGTFHIEGSFYKDGAGNATQIGATTVVHAAKTAAAALWAVDFTNDGADAIRVTCTGVAGHNIQWACSLEELNVSDA